jgi:serine/threonine protein kinase
MARFEREAQVLAWLNHPNIAAIYGVEQGALVMELVPGQTLADRIAAGALPLEEALPIARRKIARSNLRRSPAHKAVTAFHQLCHSLDHDEAVNRGSETVGRFLGLLMRLQDPGASNADREGHSTRLWDKRRSPRGRRRRHGHRLEAPAIVTGAHCYAGPQ